MTPQERSDIMARLGLNDSTLAVLGMFPLVYIAWADGKVQRAERDMIHSIAKKENLTEPCKRILDGWLAEPPSDEDFTMGMELVRELANEQRTTIAFETLTSILRMSRDVAAVAGGVLSMSSITPSEDQALGMLAQQLGLEPDAIMEAPEKKKTPPGPPGRFMVGNMPELRANALKVFVESFRTYGDIVRLSAGPFKITLLSHPEYAKHVLADNQKNYIKGRLFEPLKKITGDGLTNSDGEHWRKQRRIIQPAFHRTRVAGFVEMMVRQVRAMLDRWHVAAKRGETLNVLAEFMKLTGSIAGLAIFSSDTSGDAKELGEALLFVANYVADRDRQLAPVPGFIPTPDNQRFAASMRLLNETVMSKIESRRKGGAPGNDVLGMLLEAKDEETGEGMTDQQLRDELVTFYIAGDQTSANTLSFMSYLASMHPGVTEKARAEVKQVLGSSDPTLETIGKLEYGHRVMQESMRIFPTAWIIPRQAAAADEIGGYSIPKGSLVFMSPYCIHRHPDFWPNPEGFDPDRFLDERSEGRPQTAYLPFGGGPRKCIGYPFAQLEIQIASAMILREFRLDLVPGFQLELNPMVTLVPKNGVQMRPIAL